MSWSDTTLGAPESWPSTLKTTLATMFRARHPMFLWWGPELIQFYNDAYVPSFGQGKHPRAMGQRGRECWQEIWPIIGPQIDDVMNRGHPELAPGPARTDLSQRPHRRRLLDLRLLAGDHRDGSVGGTLVVCSETTNRVMGERRTNLLHALVAATAGASDAASLASRAFTVLARAAADIPFTALYTREASSGQLIAIAAGGLTAEACRILGERVAARPEQGDLPASVPFALGELEAPATPAAFGSGLVREAYVAPLVVGDGRAPSFIVFGLSPTLSFDDPYRRFLEQITAHLQEASIRVEEAARRAAIELERKNLIEQAPVAAALLIGPNHVFALANPLFRAMVGRPDLVGRAYVDAFPELAQTPLAGVLDVVYRQGQPFVTNEYRVAIDHRGTGVVEENRFFKFNLEPVRDGQRRRLRHDGDRGRHHRTGRCAPRAGKNPGRARGALAHRRGGHPRQGRVPGDARPRAAQPAGADHHRARS